MKTRVFTTNGSEIVIELTVSMEELREVIREFDLQNPIQFPDDFEFI